MTNKTLIEALERIAHLQELAEDAIETMSPLVLKESDTEELLEVLREIRTALTPAAEPGELRHADKLERVAAQLSSERIQGWANPLVADIMDAVRFLRNEAPKPDTGEAVLSDAILREVQPVGWRDISSAPKDERVILFSPFWGTETGYHSITRTQEHSWFSASGAPYAETEQPTHWMPLPQPPSTEGGGEDAD